jgi:hypothetical protein
MYRALPTVNQTQYEESVQDCPSPHLWRIPVMNIMNTMTCCWERVSMGGHAPALNQANKAYHLDRNCNIACSYFFRVTVQKMLLNQAVYCGRCYIQITGDFF